MHIREFAKLYQVKIPAERHFDYYMHTLAQSKEFSSLWDKFRLFQTISEDPAELKAKSMHKLINLLSGTEAYKKMLAEKAGERRPEKNIADKSQRFLSIDIRKANWSVLKSFDTNELPATWEEFCLQNEIHPAFVESKSFRQIVFGHLSPKQTQRLQAAAMTALAKQLEEAGNEIVAFTDDEITIVDPGELSLDFRLPLKTTTYQLHALAKDRYVKTTTEYKTLSGIPGNEFFFHFKRYILDQEIDERDLYFEQDKRLCKWLELPSYFT